MSRQVLLLEPSQELTFDGPFNEVVTTALKLTNPTTQHVIYFKVKTTAPRYYCVRPNCGAIAPGDTVKISVMLQPVDQPGNLEKERTKHKFMIQSAFARDPKMQVDEFWKVVDPTEIMDSKLKVLFTNQSNPNTNGSDQDSYSLDATRQVSDPSGESFQHETRAHQSSQMPRQEVNRSNQVNDEKRLRLEEDNRSLTIQVQELRHRLSSMTSGSNEGLPMVQIILMALAALLIGIIIGKLF